MRSVINKTDERYSIILNLRNAFSHSIYPDYLLFKDKITDNGFNQLKNYTKDDECMYSKSIINQFKNLTIKYYEQLSNTTL